MKTRHYVLGSVAVAALMGAVAFSAAPAFAQRDSTPAEQAQTSALNAQAAVAADSAPDDAQFEAAQKEYQEKQDQYSKQRENYQDSKEAYDAKRAQYDDKRAEYADDRAVYDSQYPEFPKDRDLMRLGNVAPRTFRGVPVVSTKGEHIGRVVGIHHIGRDLTIDVGVDRGPKITVPADAVRFDRASDVVLVSMATRDELLADVRR